MNCEFLTEFSCRYLKLMSPLDNVEQAEDDNGQHDLDREEDDEDLVEFVNEPENLGLDLCDENVEDLDVSG
jgi:hypothetical protein